MRLKYDAVWVKPNMVNVNEMICKMNEMEMNDEMNELDLHEMNRWTLVNEMNEMKMTRQICNSYEI